MLHLAPQIQAALAALTDETTVIPPPEMTLEEWATRYVDSGRAAKDYDWLCRIQRREWEKDTAWY